MGNDSDSYGGPVPSGSNEPAGYTRILQFDFTGTPPTATENQVAATFGPDWYVGQYPVNRITAYSDATAPVSPPDTWAFKFPAGEPSSTSPGQASITLAQDYSGWYERGRLKIVGSDFESQQSTACKFFGYWGAGSEAYQAGWTNPISLASKALGSGTTEPMSEWAVGFEQQVANGGTSRNLVQNANVSARFRAGEWTEYQLLMQINTLGSANGVLKFWLNDILCLDYSDIVYIDATHPYRFYGRKVDMVWGGSGGPVRSRDDTVLWDHIYVSAVI